MKRLGLWGLLAVLIIGLLFHWMIFLRITNDGLTFQNDLIIPDELRGTIIDGRRKISLTVGNGRREFIPGRSTPTAGVNGPYLGPTVRLRRGENVDLTVHNQLDEETSMHWHGMHVPARMDGTPHQLIEPAQQWTASFQVDQQAAPLWYHPHPHGRTGWQSYQGIAGQLWIDDDNSDGLELPHSYGVDDIPLVIQDRLFDSDGSLQYVRSRGAVYGDTVLINGTWNPRLDVESRTIRFRLLNGSNARIYYIGFDDDRVFHQIATDGGFLEAPIALHRLILSPGERAEILVDFSDGEETIMKSFPEAGLIQTVESFFDGAGSGHLHLLKLTPKPTTRPPHRLPERLNRIVRLDAADAQKTRSMVMGGQVRGGNGGRGQGGQRQAQAGPPINGKRMDMNRIDERVRLGDTDPKTPYMYHCHIMEHEDGGMMGQFLVVDEPEQLHLMADRATVVLFILGFPCDHCFEQVQLFDKTLSRIGVNLVVVTPEQDLDPAKTASLSSPVISDPEGMWAGWLGVPTHAGPAHGTVIVNAAGEVVWAFTDSQPYMDVDDVVERVRAFDAGR